MDVDMWILFLCTRTHVLADTYLCVCVFRCVWYICILTSPPLLHRSSFMFDVRSCNPRRTETDATSGETKCPLMLEKPDMFRLQNVVERQREQTYGEEEGNQRCGERDISVVKCDVLICVRTWVCIFWKPVIFYCCHCQMINVGHYLLVDCMLVKRDCEPSPQNGCEPILHLAGCRPIALRVFETRMTSLCIYSGDGNTYVWNFRQSKRTSN